MVSLESYLILSFVMFLLGIIAMIGRKNILAILLGAELILNSAALNFVAYSKYSTLNIDGQIMSLFIIVVAAAEAAIGLAIAIRFFKLKKSMHVDDGMELLN